MNLINFLSFWVTNSLFFFLVSLIWPQAVVLGNNVRSPITAALISGFLLTFIITIVPYLLKVLGYKIKKGKQLTLVYFVANSGGIWLIARMAKFIGFGISVFWVALMLAVLISLLQWLTGKYATKKG